MVAVHHLFHRALAAACGNRLLELLADPLQDLSNAMRLPDNLHREDWIRVDADHRAIFDAVVRSDPRAAEQATSAHLDNLGRILDRTPVSAPVRMSAPVTVGAAVIAGAAATAGGDACAD
jgi:DNA-binding FadR family transcriptional regulator